MKTRVLSSLKYLIGWPLSLLAFFFIGKIVLDQAPNLLPHLSNLNLSFLFYGLLCFIIFYFLRSYIWYRILQGYNYTVAFKDSSYLWSISELKRYIPGNIWSFLGRTILFEKKGVKKKDIGTGLIIEAELFILGCLVVSLLSLPLLLPNASLALNVLLVLLVGFIVLSYIFNRKISTKLTEKIRSILHFIFPPFDPAENGVLLGISIMALLFFGLGNYFVMSAAFATDPQLLFQLVGVFVFAFVAGYLSVLTPAGFGVREGIVVYGLIKIISTGFAAFVALFTRIILILAELVFILISFLWFKTKNTYLTKVEKWITRHTHESILFIFASMYTMYFTTLSFLRYDNYYTGRFDLGNMAQTVWNTLHGSFFMLTNPNGIENISRLAFHADFILVLLAPLYAFWQDPRMLLLIQTVVVATGAFFVYYIAKSVLTNNNLSLVLACAYLLNPSIQRANLYDFHAVTLATTFLLATYFFYLKKKYILFVLFALLAAFCKEQVWLIIALFGVLMFFHQRKRLWGSVLFFVSCGMFYFLLWYAIPQTLGAQHFALEYYSNFGDSPTKIVESILFSPDKLWHILLQPDRIHFLSQLFSPLGYLSLLFPFFLIFAGPDLIINLLSNNTQLHQIYYQYTATISPFIFLSAIYGIWVIKRFFSDFPTSVLILYVLYVSLYSVYSFGPLPGAKESNLDMITKPFENREYVDSFLKKIPPEYRISASNNLASHLSQRAYIYVSPLGIGGADMILIHASDPQSNATLEKVTKDNRYKKIIDKNGFFVFDKQ